jgi:hypothetical protein
MNKEERRELAVAAVDSIIADIQNSLKRSAAIFGSEQEAMNKIIIPELKSSVSAIAWELGHTGPEKKCLYTGERRDLQLLLGCDGWVETFHAIHNLIDSGGIRDIKAGDFVRLPVKVRGGSFGGMMFNELDIEETELAAAHVFDNKIVFQFEEILFQSAINARPSSEGGFSKSALAAYLNERFVESLSPITGLMKFNKHGQKVTLPTLFEVFGKTDEDDLEQDSNWTEEPVQFEYFMKIKNRIRAADNNTRWSWLSTAAYSTHFCLVSSGGYFGYYNASNTDGGVAPAICVS